LIFLITGVSSPWGKLDFLIALENALGKSLSGDDKGSIWAVDTNPVVESETMVNVALPQKVYCPKMLPDDSREEKNILYL
jgi:hypothetical protein